MGNFTPEQVEETIRHLETRDHPRVGRAINMLDAYATAQRQQAGRVDEGQFVAHPSGDGSIVRKGDQTRLTVDEILAAMNTAALAQNTQGEKWLNGAPMWAYIHTPATGKELVEREEAEARIAEAERARVPDAVDRALAESRKVAHLYHNGEGMLWYFEQELKKAAAPSQRAEVGRG